MTANREAGAVWRIETVCHRARFLPELRLWGLMAERRFADGPLWDRRWSDCLATASSRDELALKAAALGIDVTEDLGLSGGEG